MKVKIIKASKPTYWYADKVGRVFEVCNCWHPGGEEKYDTVGRNGEHLAIDKADCEVVE
jgi:hypothetical protein